ncbi:6-pyruvoyltetrahydropterin/6-carboxytetrahydropterin synthase [Streptoalloteichus tenebrarius]|uniref:6-carboxy-5,6,7,8-tetrahydropterin synthase n=1 Tax=Streptoalloteichus tenebrarius (strain ATCC 17920 / DSM 40477 / JCM 4838 / CBS 697.72 / NBRC 16177 / NCIMB 11028 / NRRL B-12390 / A12253. 1 / ISP 5477) TaxID=1933 RepID=A0ABT1I1I4_STRSD|nr:6-carboxytetrahydropterin synthase [Streptoalloteichus tenebrarius]MCP2261593.1 6-pyruvoyltetrahydropterin/6-carboxytetrahydropterin synthase [Streptoalloteichus tenebrarius]BFE99406.1 hypothetical protein GCM10020241_10820 [Streptoalloteichus tenebrarius]
MPAPTSPARAPGANAPERQDSPPDAHRITIRHTFETAHRLPQLGGRCASLHGHSWRVVVQVRAHALDGDLTVVEFGGLKAGVRDWVDTHLDHATMLGIEDPLVEPLLAAGCEVFRFGAGHSATDAERSAGDLAWPTTEAVAVLLFRVARDVLAGLPSAPRARVGGVLVREAPLNTASYRPDDL